MNIEKGDFTWTTDLIFTKNTEEIISLPNGDDISAGRFIGQPLTIFYDLKKIGIWQTSELDQAKAFGSKQERSKLKTLMEMVKSTQMIDQFLGSAVADFAMGYDQ